jgi:hypothetical protein
VPIEKFSDESDENRPQMMENFRNMGFPDMKHMDPDVNGPALDKLQQ